MDRRGYQTPAKFVVPLLSTLSGGCGACSVHSLTPSGHALLSPGPAGRSPVVLVIMLRAALTS